MPAKKETKEPTTYLRFFGGIFDGAVAMTNRDAELPRTVIFHTLANHGRETRIHRYELDVLTMPGATILKSLALGGDCGFRHYNHTKTEAEPTPPIRGK
jgi:hypothetical protein